MRLRQPMRTLILVTLLLFTQLSLSACGVVIKNQRWYADKGSEGAVYFETQTTATGQVAASDWAALRFGMVCTIPSNFADSWAALTKLCNSQPWWNECEWLADPQAVAFFNQMERADRDSAATVR